MIQFLLICFDVQAGLVTNSIIVHVHVCTCRVLASKRRGTERNEEDSITMAAGTSDVVQSASGQEDTSANSSDGSSKTREVAYLMYGSTSVDRDQAKQTKSFNHYLSSPFGEADSQSVVQRGNVLVECGSTQCEFEIKVYQIKASSYGSRETQVSTPSEVTDPGSPHRETRV